MQVYSNELYHYGVIGMKWGVRRYQNPDGSLKAAGQKRYNQAKTAVSNAAGKVKTVVRRPVDAVKAKTNSLSDEQKTKLVKGLKIGAAVAGTALAAYGVYKMSGVIKDKAYFKSLNSGMDAVDRLLSSSKDEFNRLPDILKAKTVANAPDNLRSGANKLTSYYNDIGSGISLSGNARANAYNNSASLSKAIATLRGKGSASSAEKIESLLKNKSDMSSDYISDRVSRILKNDPNNKFSDDAINDIKKLVEYARSNARH